MSQLQDASAVCVSPQVGPDFPLMLDCYMALSVPYSITLARRLAEPDLHFTWMEEFLPPDAYDGYEDSTCVASSVERPLVGAAISLSLPIFAG